MSSEELSREKKVQIKEIGGKRVVEIHSSTDADKIKLETSYSKELLELILSVKGAEYLKDEIDRAESPSYVKKNLLSLINRFTGIKGKKVLDFGSGSGASSVILAREGARVIGIEPDESLINIARLRARDSGVRETVDFVRSMLKLPFKRNSFDVIICNAVIEHIHPKEREAHLKELWAVLKRGGHLFVNETPNRLWPVDIHTTGLLLLPYMPLSLARKYAIFRNRASPSDSIDDLIKKGIKGSTYWEIVNSLKNEEPIELNKYADNVEDYFRLSESLKQSWIKKIVKMMLKYFYKAADLLICKPLRIPVCALLPELRICLRKGWT